MNNHLRNMDPARLELPAKTMNSGLTSPSFSMLMSHEMLTPSKQKVELEFTSNHLYEQPEFLYSGLEEQKMPFSNKRKATMELGGYNPSFPNTSISNKRAALSPRNPGVQSKSPRTSVSNKKMEQIEPVMTKSKNRNMKSKASLGVEDEKFDPVRSKLRESLTAALALVFEQKASSLDTDKTEKGESKPATTESSTAICNNIESANKYSDVKTSSEELYSKDESEEPWKFLGSDFHSNPIFPSEDAPFGESLFLRDELLQGNGLSWAMDFDAQIAEIRAVDSTQSDELVHEEDVQEKEQVDMSPEAVAFRIESEMFTFFGGVNKKYKEKGRSLLFNLKDHNNPELRERVMSGEIPPERLCSMTAEELASKELSQWRMAKAEELDNMKVLPETEVNVRRLVKKTHKGEYQVDFDQDISVVEDVPTNLSVARENGRRKTSGQHTVTIPGEDTDMLGLMVDDIRDLPPILSLDEFMDSLDKEPPFENLPIESERTPELDNSIAEDSAKSMSPPPPSKDPVVSSLSDSKKVKEVDEQSVQSVQSKGHGKSAENKRASETTIVTEQVKVEYLWEGLLQLTLSSTAYVVAIYKSGEKASTRDWPSSFEIKGRVRLDAFDKFLQELPKSRTRATMVVHFALAKRCTEDERCNLIDLIDSYVTDQRLGYAEPSPGVELYMCPPRSKTVDMIVNHLPKAYTENLTDIDNGLIGILVWRKERLPSATLPNPSLQHKHTSPNEHSTSGRQLPVKEVNRNVSIIASRAVPLPKSSNDDDDAPPGFGPPGGAQEDDDLPEFNFSAAPNSSRFPAAIPQSPPPRGPVRPEVPSQQLEQMRALIQKYGKSGDNSVNGIPIKPWNDDDDDDDIPEWQPTVHSHTPPGFPTHKPALVSHVPDGPSFMRPVVIPDVPSFMQPVVQPSIATQGTWRHPGRNTVRPTGNPRTRGQPTRAQFYGHKNRGGRSANGFSRSRGV